MNEIEAIKSQLGGYRAVVARQIDRLYNALEELQRTTLFLLSQDTINDDKIDEWLQAEGFAVDHEGFFQSQPLLFAARRGDAPADAISFSWGQHLRVDPTARHHMYSHRNIGSHLQHIHDRLGDVGWIYYQDASNTALQYPYIDQRTAISSDFDWSSYHTFLSVCPENNPERDIQWTPPTIDYAGEGLILSLSIPVWRDDNYIGLWSIDLPLRYLYRDFFASKIFADQMLFIANHQSMLVLHENLHAEIDQAKGKVYLHSLVELGGQWEKLELETLLSKEEGVLTVTDAAQTEWIFCHYHIPSVRWTLFSGLPKLSMEEAAAKRLGHAFKQVAAGNFSHRIEPSSTNAFLGLVDEFNEMSLRLSQAEEHRNEMENQLRQAQKMEAIGRLAGGVAHDYNNMVGVIMGYAELALVGLDTGHPLYANLHEIYKAGKRCMELTRQLLAFARCQPVARVVLDINNAVGNMLNLLERLIGEDIELIWHLDEQIWPLQIDPSQVDQILTNLCANARDAISGVGKIIIKTSNTELDVHFCAKNPGSTPGEFVQLTVSDNGAGMDMKVLDKVFEPFYSTKSIGKGIGLGLATVYGIVKQNQGYISVYSDLNSGTTFKIYLPRFSDKTVDIPPNNIAEISCGHNETLLLVEDDSQILQLVQKMLSQLNYRVLATKSPLEAISIAEHHPDNIDILVTDVIMPELNGRDLANRLQHLFPRLKVLFMSGYTSDIIVDRGVLNNDVVLLQKPFSKKELAFKIRDTLAKSG